MNPLPLGVSACNLVAGLVFWLLAAGEIMGGIGWIFTFLGTANMALAAWDITLRVARNLRKAGTGPLGWHRASGSGDGTESISH